MGTSDQRFSLRWNNYQSHLVTAFESLLEEKDFVDVTLGVEGRKLPAHKMLLSACSPYFRDLLKGNPCQHPIIVLRDIKYDDLFSLLQFMYNGEVNVAQDQLNSFLKSAESLKIRGLTDNDSGSSSTEESRTAPPPPPRPPSRDSMRDLQPPPIKRKRPYPDHQQQASATPSPKRVVAAPLITPPPPPPTQTATRPEPVKQEVIELGDDQYEETDQGHYDEGDGGDGGEVYSEEGQGYHPGEGAMVPHGEGEEGMDGGDGTQGLALWNYEFLASRGSYLRGSYEKQGLYQCPQCDKRFESPKSLSNHQAVHDGKTTCTICGKVESTRSNLNRHLKITHPETCVL